MGQASLVFSKAVVSGPQPLYSAWGLPAEAFSASGARRRHKDVGARMSWAEHRIGLIHVTNVSTIFLRFQGGRNNVEVNFLPSWIHGSFFEASLREFHCC